MGTRALGLDVTYGRDGEHPGVMFVSRRPGGPELELTTPMYVIAIEEREALNLYAEMKRLFGWSNGIPSP